MKVSSVQKGSVADKLGVKAGDTVLEFDGHKAVDILDCFFYDQQKKFEIKVLTVSGLEQKYNVKKPAGEPLGLEFEDDGLNIKSCKNKCIFCFIDQLPSDKNLRDTLRVKDDDYRHSFLNGNYITTTNLTEDDIQRILRLKLSPLYLSVHTLDEDLRKTMLGVKNAPDILPLIKRLSEGGIELHFQIVYCPGFNEDIKDTITKLAPYRQSIAVVPVGLTKYHNKILSPVTKEQARKVIDLVDVLVEKFREPCGQFASCADEFYIKAELELPNDGYYEGYPQLENGVGLISQFNQDFEYALYLCKDSTLLKKKKFGTVSVVTGESFYPFLIKKADELMKSFNIKINVFKIKNEFFGRSVTVTGLLVGGDIIAQLEDKDLGDRLLIPSVCFRDGTEDFLDNSTLADVSQKLNIKAQKVESGGDNFIYGVFNIKEDNYE